MAPESTAPEIESLSFSVDEEMAGQRLDLSLAQLSGLPRSQIQRWITAGRVRVDGQEVRRGNRTLLGGQRIDAVPPEVTPARIDPEAIPLQILYEDSDLIVIDKAAGMVVHPAPGHAGGTLVNALLHHCGDLAGIGGVLRPGIVHRLDRGTSGVMVAAKNDFAHVALSEQFQAHSIERIYLAFVRGVPAASEGRVDRPVGRHPRDRKRMSVQSSARARGGDDTLELCCENAIRRRLNADLAQGAARDRVAPIRSACTWPASGHPRSSGIRVYGRARARHASGVTRLARPALHAAVLGFDHPRSKQCMRFEAPLADDLEALLAELRALEQ